MNTAKDFLHKLVDDIPETKVGEVLDFLLFLREKPEHDLYLSPKEEEEILRIINHDERISSDKAKELLLGE